MYKFTIGYLILFFSMPFLSQAEVVRISLLPEYMIYALFAYGYWKIGKILNHDEVTVKHAKSSLYMNVIFSLICYGFFMLDLFGITSKLPDWGFILISLTVSLMEIVSLYMFLDILKSIQGWNHNFQVKRINMLVSMKGLCVACQYISLLFVIVESFYTFLIFEIVVDIILVVYLFTTAMTFKQKYIMDGNGDLEQGKHAKEHTKEHTKENNQGSGKKKGKKAKTGKRK